MQFLHTVISCDGKALKILTHVKLTSLKCQELLNWNADFQVIYRLHGKERKQL